MSLEGQEHSGKGRQPHKEVEDDAAVGVVGAIVVGLGGVVGQACGGVVGVGLCLQILQALHMWQWETEKLGERG